MIKIKKKNKKLGKNVKKLEFKIIKQSKNRNTPMYHIVLSRKRSSNKSRLDKVGFFHFATRPQISERTRLLALDFEKIKSYVIKGASFHRSVFKFLI